MPSPRQTAASIDISSTVCLNQLSKEIHQLKIENGFLREKIRLLQHQKFGKTTERVDDDYLPGMEDEKQDAPEDAEDFIEVPAHKKKKPGRKKISEDLPREEVTVDLPEHEKVCDKHGVALKKIGEERAETVEYVPAIAKVIVTVRPKYICPCCEEKEVKIAPVEERLIPKSMVTPSLLAHIVISKFIDHLPLYRQEQIFARMGLEITRSTLARWLIQFGDALIPILNLLDERLRAGPYISCDETRMRVLTENGNPVKGLHFIWVKGRPEAFGPPIYIYEYANSRSSQVARSLLEGFSGYLQVDQYAGYNFVDGIPTIIRVGCLAHIRRKFFDARKASKGSNKIAAEVIRLIKKLYRIHNKMGDYPEEERTALRVLQSQPILEELHTVLESRRDKVPPQSMLGKAITYALNSWPDFLRVYSDWRINLDNNLTENAIRPVALGRKNYLFCNSDHGARAVGAMYSIITTARANGLDVREYLIRLIDQLPKAKTLEDYEALLPLPP